MAEVVRLKSWTTYLEDGKSSVTYKIDDKKKVGVFLGVGVEPASLIGVDEKEIINVDDFILKLAAAIRKSRKEKKASAKANVPS